VAVAAVEAFFDRALDQDVVTEAFGAVRLPGRFEVLHRAPLLVLDGAHNPPGAAAAARTLADEFDVAGTRHWVIGPLAGRDVDELLDAFAVRPGDHVVATVAPTPRGVPAEVVAEAARRRGARADAIADVEAAVAAAWGAAEAAGEGDLVMVTGSLNLVGAARTACRKLGLLAG
jgi:dihydrofolate synthase / folylpolyglutamate synthase